MDEEVIEEWIHQAAKNYHKWELREQFDRQSYLGFSKCERIEATGVACAILQLNNWYTVETGCDINHDYVIFVWCWSEVLKAPMLISLTKHSEKVK